MTTWSVLLEVPRPAGSAEPFEMVGDLLEVLTGSSAVASAGVDKLGIRLCVKGEEADQAIGAARAVLEGALRKVGWDEQIRLASATAQTMEDLEAELAQSHRPDLVGVAGAAEMLGVKKQRVSQLGKQRDFPPPIANLAAGPVWLRDSLRRFTGRQRVRC